MLLGILPKFIEAVVQVRTLTLSNCLDLLGPPNIACVAYVVLLLTDSCPAIPSQVMRESVIASVDSSVARRRLTLRAGLSRLGVIMLHLVAASINVA